MKSFVSSKGCEIKLKPVSQFKLDSLRMAKEDIPVPTYIVTTVSGEEQTFQMDEETAISRGEVELWNAYKKKHRENESEYAKLFLEMVVWEGTDVDVPDDNSDWYKVSQRFKMKVPTDPVERKLFYVYNELLGTPDDIGDLIADIFALSKVPEEAVAKLQASFRSGIQKHTDTPVTKK